MLAPHAPNIVVIISSLIASLRFTFVEIFKISSSSLVTHDRRKLERVQERALRIIFNSKTDTYDALLSRAKLPSLHNRRLQDIAILMFKVKNGLVPDDITELFTNSNKGYSLRNADFDLPRVSSVRYGKHSIRYLGPYL